MCADVERDRIPGFGKVELAHYFVRAWKALGLPDDVWVEVTRRGPGRPCAMIAFDVAKAGWRVLVDYDQSDWEFLVSLCHEGAHVQKGLQRGGVDWDSERAWFEGRALPALVEARIEGYREGRKLWEGYDDHEAAVEAWAHRKAALLWDALRDWRNVEEAVRVVEWTRTQQERTGA